MTMIVSDDTIDRKPEWRNPGGASETEPAMIAPHAIAELFKRVDLALYGDARRDFLARANLEPNRRPDEAYDAAMQRAFENWFAFDCELDVCGQTPFDLASRYLRRKLKCIGRRAYTDLREVSATNRASWYRIVDANAASGRIWLEDRAGSDVYAVHARELAAEFDGTRRGTLVGRIAEARGVWKMIGTPLHVSRREDADRAHLRFCRMLSERRPQYVDLVRFLYGRDTGNPADCMPWHGTEHAPGPGTMNAHVVEELWSKLSRVTV